MQIASPPAMRVNDGVQETSGKQGKFFVFFLYLAFCIFKSGVCGAFYLEAVSGAFEMNEIKFTPCSCEQGLSFPVCNGGEGP